MIRYENDGVLEYLVFRAVIWVGGFMLFLPGIWLVGKCQVPERLRGVIVLASSLSEQRYGIGYFGFVGYP